MLAKFFLTLTSLAGLATAAATSQDDLSAVAIPNAPGLTYLYSMNCTLGEVVNVGATPNGNRIVIPIVGGTFSGPRMSGTILNLGADWALAGNDGSVFVDTRYQLRTDDGADIFIQTNGPAQLDGTLHLRVRFETGHPDYLWLNRAVGVGILRTGTGYVLIDAWTLESPKA